MIDEATPDLELSLDVFKDRPDVVTMKKYQYKNEIAYFYEPMREELQDLEGKTAKKRGVDGHFDTIVCPAFEHGFKHAFVENDAWWAIRISQRAREQLRYLAIYEKSPVAAIRNVAEITKIELYKSSGKFIVFLEEKKDRAN